MKKLISLILILLLTVGMIPLVHASGVDEAASAIRADNTFFIDAKRVVLHAYVIEEEIYVNLFETAIALIDTEKKFSLAWSEGGQALRIVSGRPYKAIGVNKAGTLPQAARAENVNIKVFLDGENIEITSFKVENEIYFNLRQIVRAMDFNIISNTDDSNIELITDTPYQELPLRKIDPDLPMIALTFDDGPVRYTNEILDILEEHEVVATFYVIGTQVNRATNTLLRAVELGNEIGNHTMNHVNLRNLSYDGVHRQLVNANTRIEEVTGIAPLSMRPPFGELNNNVRNVSAALGMPIIIWSIDPLDWLTKDAGRTYTHIIERVKDGDIILLHDTHSSTVRATARLIPALLDMGFQFVTVSELFQYKEVESTPGRSYSSVRG